MRNWTIKEAVEVINAGTDLDAIKEIAKHFPMFFLAVARNDITALTQMMGDRFTVRRLVVPQDTADADADVEDTGAGEVPIPPEPADLSAMSTKDLMKLCDQRGLKVPHYGKNKQFYIDALANDGGVPAEEAPAKAKRTPPSRKAKKAEPEAKEVEEDEDVDPYAGMAAPDLYKECKSRGIKAAAKKPAKYYADLLRKADAEAEAEDDGGWDDEEEEAPAPKANKGTKKSKAAKEDDDDDGDWDI